MVGQEEIHNLCHSFYPKERVDALVQLEDNFPLLSNKQLAWNDLHRLTSDKDYWVRSKAAHVLCSIFSDLPDKQQAWDDLHRLTSDEDGDVRSSAVYELRFVFSQVPDKQQAWSDLHRLNRDRAGSVRYSAVEALKFVFSQVPDKQQAWNDLHGLTSDEFWFVRSRAVIALGSVFSHIPDKQQAWNDLHRLTSDEDSDVRACSAEALDSVFSHIPDKQQAWDDLIRLISDEDSDVMFGAIYALGSVFSHIPNKQKACNDLHRLTSDEDRDVRACAAEVLGSAFSQVPDQQRAWNDLLRLTNDEDSSVRTDANYSLGRVSIFKASQAETDEDYKKELEKAIEFFETSAKVASSQNYYNPAHFCLPFYRSFHTIIFKKQEAIEEMNKYLEEAKASIEGSESKKQLFESVENLASALKDVQSLETIDLRAMKGELNFYRKYCDRAAELMREAEEKAPHATAAMRKGLPILDRNLKRILEEIQDKAKIACRNSIGTDTEEIACVVNQEIQTWEVGSQEEMTQMIENLAYILEEKISTQPKNQYILGKIDQMKSERNLVRQYEILSQIIPLIRNVTVVPVEPVLEKIESLEGKLDAKLEEMIVSLKSGPKAELVISKGPNIAGFGAQIVTTIPLAEMKYPEINIDLEEIKEEGTKLSELRKRFADKIKGYLP